MLKLKFFDKPTPSKESVRDSNTVKATYSEGAESTNEVTLIKSYLGNVTSRLTVCENRLKELQASLDGLKTALEESKMGRKDLSEDPRSSRTSSLMKAILNVLEHENRGMRVVELTYNLKSHRPSISRSLSALVRSGAVGYRLEGRSRIYFRKSDSTDSQAESLSSRAEK
jgi:DNA-binding transcriptional ArsR family regulator